MEQLCGFKGNGKAAAPFCSGGLGAPALPPPPPQPLMGCGAPKIPGFGAGFYLLCISSDVGDGQRGQDHEQCIVVEQPVLPQLLEMGNSPPLGMGMGLNPWGILQELEGGNLDISWNSGVVWVGRDL